MTLPTDYVDGDVLTAADVNAITTAVNAITSVGKVKKVATASNTSGGSTSSATYVDTGIQISYTPVNASNTLIISCDFYGGISGFTGSGLMLGEFQIYDSTAAAGITVRRTGITLDSTSSNDRQYQHPIHMIGITNAGSTSARTYKLRFQKSAGTCQVDAFATATQIAYITVTEVEI